MMYSTIGTQKTNRPINLGHGKGVWINNQDAESDHTRIGGEGSDGNRGDAKLYSRHYQQQVLRTIIRIWMLYRCFRQAA